MLDIIYIEDFMILFVMTDGISAITFCPHISLFGCACWGWAGWFRPRTRVVNHE